MNEQSLAFFSAMAHTAELCEESVKLAAHSDYSDMDAAFILDHVDANSTVLELGAGTGLVVNKICNHVAHITAVEQFAPFTKFIKKNVNINIVIQNIFTYTPATTFDIILFFGLMHYMNRNEAEYIYKKYFTFLNNSGFFIIKNQFGIDEDVIISGYSEEQQTEYYAQYRHINSEVEMLKDIGFARVTVTDIYPPECNRWKNTHFYAVTAAKED